MEDTLPSLINEAALERMVDLAMTTPKGGNFCEVGVYKGGSARFLMTAAQRHGAQLWLYDTFVGIPHSDPAVDNHVVGDFKDTDLAELQKALPDAIFRAGVFPASIDTSMAPLSFVHLDVDQYRSYIEAIDALLPLMMPGGIMVFDDYHALPGAKKAIDEKFGDQLIVEAMRVHYIHKGAF